MSEVFERAVTALRDYAADYAAGEGCEELPDRAWCATMVRAVLAAIRDPDGAMIDAGAATYGIGDGVIGPLPASMLEGQPSKTWQAMIEEMLRDV